MLGRAGDELFWLHDGAPPEGFYRPADLQRAIALAAAEASRISNGNVCGQGVWRHDGLLYVVNGDDVLRLDDSSQLIRLNQPRIQGRVFQLDADRQWTDSQYLIENTARMTRERAHRVVSELRNVLAQSCWTCPHDARIVAFLVVATLIQSCWGWRPLVSIVGPTNCGKSSLFQFLEQLFGSWTIRTDLSTEAGLRQTIRSDAAPVLVDEFDQYDKRKQVLELFRTSSRGGRILRGTASQTGIAYGLHHIGWFAGIEAGLILAQDRNRFAAFDLGSPQHGSSLLFPPEDRVQQMGRLLMATAIRFAGEAVPLATQLGATAIPGVDRRIVESFAVPVAFETLIHPRSDGSLAFGRRALLHWLRNRADVQTEIEHAESILLQHILSVTIPVAVQRAGQRSTEQRTIGQLLDRYDEHSDLLEANGLRLVDSRHGSRALFIAHTIVREKLLKDTCWHQAQIDSLLLRLDGRREQQRCGGVSQRHWGVSLPWPLPGTDDDEPAGE